jgi:hypothetical protein
MPIASPPPVLQAMLFGKVKVEEPGVVITEAAEEIHVSLSGSDDLWHFRPGDRWTVSQADGTVLYSGTIVAEAGQWEMVTGFARLDDGREVAYSLDTGANWGVYPAEQMCELAQYYVDNVPDGSSMVRKGFVDATAICREKLGITEGIPETP